MDGLMSNASEPRLLTVRETAAYLSCSVNNVYALIDSGQLPFVRIGNAKGYRIDLRDIEEFIDSRKRSKQSTEQLAHRPPQKLRHLRLK
jgi:excisionase family DNA binding protein